MTLAYQLLLSKDLIHHYRSTRDLKKGTDVQRKESRRGMYIACLFCILLALCLSSARDKVIGDSGRVTNMNETFFPLQGIQNPASFKYKIFQRSLLCLSLNTVGLLSMINARKLFSVERRKGNTNKHNEIFFSFYFFFAPQNGIWHLRDKEQSPAVWDIFLLSPKYQEMNP